MKFLSLACLACVTAVSCHAVALTLDDDGFIAAITELDVGGSLYDVTFQYGRYTDIFAAAPPTFLGQQGLAVEAGHAMVELFNSNTPSAVFSPVQLQTIWIPHTVDLTNQSFISVMLSFNTSAETQWSFYHPGISGATWFDTTSYQGWNAFRTTVFSPSATRSVPDSAATFPLLAAGMLLLTLAGIGLKRREARAVALP